MLYLSEKTNKSYKTVKELEAAEKEFDKAEEEKKHAIELRKAEATEVKAAIKSRVEAEVEARKAKAEAYEIYLKACEEAETKVRAAKQTEKEKLTEFCKSHPEGFHDTIKIGDVTYTYDYSEGNETYVDPFTRLLKWWF